jgi:uncharacterized membrane protein
MLTTLVLAGIIVLVHEMGHAFARTLSARRSFTPADVRVARLDAMVGAVDLEGPWRPDTFTRLSAARTTANDALRVALAGPVASVGIGLAAAATTADLALVGGLTSVVYGLACLVPLPDSDGRRALDASAALRQLRT